MASQQIVPITFVFTRLPVTWTIRNSALYGQINRESASRVLSELNGWHWRDEFFALPRGDVDRLAAFLSGVGAWPGQGEPNPNAPGHALRFPLIVQPEDVWSFRDDLKDALANHKLVKETVAPGRSSPKSWSDLFSHSSANSFEMRFELSNVTAGVVTITNARHMLFATLLADVARGIRFKICKRKGCEVSFPITSRHKKDYHSRECGHLALMQRKRRAERKKRARKSLRYSR
jgi:hypothetical protein